MCSSGGGGNNGAAALAAAQARDDQVRREHQIATGRAMVNSLFDRGHTNIGTYRNPDYAGWTTNQTGRPRPGPEFLTAQGGPVGQAFDAGFYDRYRQANLAYYTPMLDRQYDDAREEMAYALARAGLTRSTVAADKQGDLARDFQEERGAVATRAEEGVNRLRADVEGERATLLAQLEAANDPVSAANGALARTSALATRPVEYSPLGDVFAGASQGIGGFITGLRERRLLDAVSSTAAPSGVRGASRTVGG